MLAAYHGAFSETLRDMVTAVPLPEAAQVLDLACGDGAYSRWFAQRLEARGCLVAVDLLESYLQLAGRDAPANSLFVRADAGTLPFADDTFDLAWCAQSLYSLPRTRVVLHEMLRVIKPGGTLAILENDTLHHVLLPWPVELELKIRTAELQALSQQTRDPAKFYFGRKLAATLQSCGLTSVTARAWATTRQAPLAEAEAKFLDEYLQGVWSRVESLLTRSERDELRALIDRHDPRALLRRDDLTLTCLDHLVWGIKPRVSDPPPAAAN